MDCFLGLDLGTSSIKVLLLSETGQVLGAGAAEYPVSHPQPGYAEQDVNDWRQAAIRATRQATGWGNPDWIIRGIGVTGQMHGTVLLGDALEPISPAIIWSDGRSWRQAETLNETIGLSKLTTIAGSAVAAGFQAATIAWIQQEEASRWWRAKVVLSPVDELRRWLTGDLQTDPSEASGTLLADVRWRSWSPDLLDGLRIPATKLPRVLPAASIGGHLTATAAEALGLETGLPVVVGAADAAAGLLGAGIVDASTMLLSISTGAQVMVPSETVSADPLGRTHTFCSALEPGPGSPGWYRMGATLVAGMALRWLRSEMLDLRGPDAYERMLEWAADSKPGANGLLFLPYLVGERTPYLDARLRGSFLGMAERHTRGDIVRAVLEGTTLATKDAFDLLAEQGASPRRIIMAGGGARGPLWRQIVADMYGLPVVALGVADLAARGAAVLAMAGVTGQNPVSIAGNWVSYADTREPNPRLAGRYAELHGLFREAVVATREMSHKLVAFTEPTREPVKPARPPRVRRS